MNQLIAMSGEMTMGTREIAELLGKQHHHIKSSADYLVSKGAIHGGVALTETPYRYPQALFTTKGSLRVVELFTSEGVI